MRGARGLVRTCRSASSYLPCAAYSFPKLRRSCERNALDEFADLSRDQFAFVRNSSACAKLSRPRFASARSRKAGTSSTFPSP